MRPRTGREGRQLGMAIKGNVSRLLNRITGTMMNFYFSLRMD